MKCLLRYIDTVELDHHLLQDWQDVVQVEKNTQCDDIVVIAHS